MSRYLKTLAIALAFFLAMPLYAQALSSPNTLETSISGAEVTDSPQYINVRDDNDSEEHSGARMGSNNNNRNGNRDRDNRRPSGNRDRNDGRGKGKGDDDKSNNGPRLGNNRRHNSNRDKQYSVNSQGVVVDEQGRPVDIWGNPLDRDGMSTTNPGINQPPIIDTHRHNRPGYYGGYKYYNRNDNIYWPQVSARFCFGLWGEYNRWRNTRQMNLDANLQALFVYVDDALAISISSHPNWSNAQLDAQAMLIFRDYVDRNVTTMMVENGTYYIMYRNQGVADGEGEWVVTPVDETWIEENMGSAPIALPQGSANVPGITPEGAEPGPSVPRNSTNGDLRQSTRDAFNAAENAWNSQLP